MAKTIKRKRQSRPTKSDGMVKGKTLRQNVAVQRRYVSDMQKLVDAVIKQTEKEVVKIFKTDASKEYFATDASIASIARINMNKLINQVMKVVGDKSVTMAERMVKATDKNSKSNINSSLKGIAKEFSINTNISTSRVQDAFTSSVNVNVDLIKTINSNYLEQVKGAVNRSIQGGGGLETLIPDIEKVLSSEAKKVRNKAKNTALDQTRKAYNSLNAARMDKIGVKEYEWVHSGGGQTPRPLHANQYPAGLNGGIFSLDDPPVINEKTGARGIPGEEINCGCVMRPIITFNDGE